MSTIADMTLAVPTFNGGERWHKWVEAYQAQHEKPNDVLIIDSSSTDDTAAIARDAGFRVMQISPAEFNHGRTRQMAVDLSPQAKIICFMTQDAVLARPDSLKMLRQAFIDPQVKAAFGRQLPFPHAGPLEAFPRLFNYPEASYSRSLADAKQVGIKAAFFSNSFAAYDREQLLSLGGFPCATILGEDTYVAAKMLLAGLKIAYCAEASVYHSHDYTALEEFRRYFDIGVFHSREAWMLREFGAASSEGLRYLVRELRYLASDAPIMVPFGLIRSAAKICGYRLGRLEASFPVSVKKRLSLHRGYWSK
jgi:rhamnosyltransferase